MATSYDLGAVSTYALAVQHGFVGTISDWIQAIVSASETYSTLEEQIESLELNIPLLDSTLTYNDRAANAYYTGEYLRRLETLISTPLTASTVAGMTDTTKVYVYTGSETGYTSGNWYYYNGTAWVSGGVYNAEAVATDTTLTIAGSAADAKKVGDELADVRQDLQDLQEEIEGGGSGSGLTDDIKEALLQLAEKVGYIDNHGQAYYNDLYDALYPATPATGISLSPSTLAFGALNTTQQITATLTPSGATSVISWVSSDTSVATVSSSGLVTSVAEGTATITATANGYSATCSVTVEVATLSSISCVYTQSGTVYDTDSLDSLKMDLVVTAHWSNNTTSTVASTDYTLSGTLAEGTSTITVSYGGKTTTFTVTVTASPIEYLYNWDLTESLIDSVNGSEITLGAKSGESNPTRDSSGLSFNAATQYAYLGVINPTGKTFEIDVSNFDFKGSTSYHIRFFSNAQYATATSKGLGCIVWRKDTNQGWTSYGWLSGSAGSSLGWSSSLWNSNLAGNSSAVLNAFSGKTVKVVYHSDGHTKDLYLDNDYMGTISDIYFDNYSSTMLSNKIFIGGMMSVTQGSGDQCYDMTITGIRIYETVEVS